MLGQTTALHTTTLQLFMTVACSAYLMHIAPIAAAQVDINFTTLPTCLLHALMQISCVYTSWHNNTADTGGGLAITAPDWDTNPSPNDQPVILLMSNNRFLGNNASTGGGMYLDKPSQVCTYHLHIAELNNVILRVLAGAQCFLVLHSFACP